MNALQAGVVAVLATSLLITYSPQRADAAPNPGRSLVVVVEGLPPATPASVLVRGPAGFSLTITRSQRLTRIRPGIYSAAIGRVGARGLIFSAAAPVVRVRVANGPARIIANYADAVRSTTKVLDRTSLRGARALPHGAVALAISAVAARGLQPGGYLVAGVTRLTKTGFVGRIVAISKPASGLVTVTTVPAAITDVVSQGSLHAALQNLTPQPNTGSVTPQSARPTSTPKGINQNVSCGGGGVLSLVGSAQVSAGVNVDAGWHSSWSHPIPKIDSASFTGTLGEGLSLTASVSGAAQCTLADTDIGPAIGLGTFEAFLGDVPVVLSPKLQFSISGRASASAATVQSFNQSFSATAGLRWTPTTGVTPVETVSNRTSYSSPAPSASAMLSGTVTATVTVGIDGTPLGPDVAAHAQLTLSADTQANPWWRLAANIAVDASINLAKLRISVPSRRIYSHDFPIAQAPGAFLIAAPAPAAPAPIAPPPPVLSVRHLTSYSVDPDLNCAAYIAEDGEVGEFFGGNACGTFLSVDGVAYGPTSIPAGSAAAGNDTPLTIVSQTDDGAGTLTTVATAGASGVQLTETDHWSAGGSTVVSDYSVQNTDGSAHQVVLVHAWDCYLADSDLGTGQSSGPGNAACVHDNGDGTFSYEGLTATGDTPHSVVAYYDDVWADVSAALTSGNGLTDGCRCDPTDTYDNGEAVSWAQQILPGQTLNTSSTLSFTA